MIQQGEEEAYHHRVHVEGENVALQSLSWFPGRFPTVTHKHIKRESA